MILTPAQIARRADFYFQLGSLISAGVPLLQALDMARVKARSFRGKLATVIARIHGGSTFSEALEAAGDWLPQFDRAVISAGEHSGRLDATLKTLGNYYQERASLLRRMISDMAYPMFLVHLAVLIFPTSLLTNLVWSGGVERFVIHKVSILVPLYAVTFVMIAALQSNRGETWRALMERILNAVPLVGGARKSLALARFTAGLEATLSAGIPIIQAWQIAAGASGSNRIKQAVGWAVPRMESGMVPSEAVRQLSVFPELFQSLYATGEMSGKLDSTLERLHRHYQEEATLRFQNIGQWTPKILFLLVAIAVAFQVIGFYSNYFGQLQKTGL